MAEPEREQASQEPQRQAGPQRDEGPPPPNVAATPPADAKRAPAEHLAPHRFQKGKSGNPGGRPKGSSITAELRELLDNEHNGKRVASIVAELLLKGALKGSLPHLKEVLDRAEGKATDRVHISGSHRVYTVKPPRLIGQSEEEWARLNGWNPPEQRDGTP